MAHEVAVALAGGATAFVESPDDEALAAAAITGGEDAFEVGGILLEVGLDVSARIAVNTEVGEQRLVWSQKAH